MYKYSYLILSLKIVEDDEGDLVGEKERERERAAAASTLALSGICMYICLYMICIYNVYSKMYVDKYKHTSLWIYIHTAGAPAASALAVPGSRGTAASAKDSTSTINVAKEV